MIDGLLVKDSKYSQFLELIMTFVLGAWRPDMFDKHGVHGIFFGHVGRPMKHGYSISMSLNTRDQRFLLIMAAKLVRSFQVPSIVWPD